MNDFEKGTRDKVRFAYKGQTGIEDVWDLSVEDLDGIYQKLMETQREMSTDSLLEQKRTGSRTLELKINIVKHMVTVKLAEAEAREQAAENKLYDQRVDAIIAKKQDAGLEEMSIEDLQKSKAERKKATA